MHSSRHRIAFAAALLLAGAACGFLLHMRHVLQQSADSAAASHRLAFRFGPFPEQSATGFEPVASPASFQSAAVVGEALFVAGPGAVAEYQEGELRRSFRAGLELPGVPLGQVIAGRLRGETQRQVIVATHGAGVLLLDPANAHVRQLLPDDNSLRDVRGLAMLASGDLLIATHGQGVLDFDGSGLRFYRPEFAGAALTSLLTVGDDVWAGTEEHGLLHAHAGVVDRFESELPDPHIAALAASGDAVYAATPVGIVAFQNGRIARTLAPGVFARAIYAGEGTLLAATWGQGTLEIPLNARARIRPATLETEDSPDRGYFAAGDAVYAVRPDRVVERRGSAWTDVVRTPATVIADRNSAALAFDAEGRLWVGTFDRGLDVLDPALSTARHFEDDHLFCINRLIPDPVRGTMDVATANGLVMFDSEGRPRQVLGRRDGLLSDHVSDVAFTSAGMTVATPAGLSFVRADGIDSLYAFQGLVNNHVYALAASGDTLLAGTLGGISLLDHDAVQRNFNVNNSGLRHNWITSIAHSGNGYLIGTYGGGLERMDSNGSIVPMEGAPRDLIVNPNALLVSGTRAYAGSLNAGLWVYSTAAARWTQVIAGLPSRNVTALAERNGELYVGTDNGLVRVPEARLP
jgi:hypothetical protein